MSRVLLIDVQGCMLDFSLRCGDAGHRVKYFFPSTSKTENIGKGLVDRVPDYRDWLRWADIVILGDNTRYLRDIDSWRKNRGLKVVGATEESAAWEIDREVGQQVFRKAGIPTIPYKTFDDYDQAIAYVKKEGRRFVSKPCGDVEDKALSYCAKTPADMVYMLQKWKRKGQHKDPFILQEFIPGIEMAVGAWVGPDGFSEGWCENWEEKSLMAGGTGPATGEMGTTIWMAKKSKLADKVLAPLEDAIVKTGHIGYIDVNCIIDEDGNPWPLEFTMRMGWPTFNIQQDLIEGDPVEWLACLSEGQDERPWRLNELALGVVMAIPDFPYSQMTRKNVIGAPLLGITPSIRPRIHPCEVMAGTAPVDVGEKIVEMPCWVTAGDYVLVATGTGKTVREARSQAYRVMNRLKVPSSPFWRPDIGQRLRTQLPQLQAMGYAMDLAY